MNDKTINVFIDGKDTVIAAGTPLLEIARQHDDWTKRIVGAVVDKKQCNLDYILKRDCRVELISIEHPIGADIYKRSCSFLLAKAMHELQRNARLVIRHSLGNGYYYDLYADIPVSASMLEWMTAKIKEIIASNVKIERISYDLESAKALFTKKAYADKARLLNSLEDKNVNIYQCGKYIDLDYGPLVPSTGYIKGFQLKPYDSGFLLLFPDQKDPTRIRDFIDQPKLFEIYRESKDWSMILEINNVGRLNEIIVSNEINEYIRIAETFHEKKIGKIADEIAKRKREIRIITISGPSSSGKTTFSKRLCTHLRVCGLRPMALSLDNYFVNRDDNPRDEHGNYDFETIKALDLDLFNRHLVELLKGREIEVPKFSFEQGKRLEKGGPLRLYSDQILIIEGVHGLNPELTYLIPADKKYKIYVSLLTQLNNDDYNRISTTDARSIRRIVRDAAFRGYSAQETLSRWPSVKRGEVKWIFPFQEEADMIFNSSLIYELAVLKGFSKKLLLDITQDMPEFSEANRLLKFLSLFKTIPPDGIPQTSILREFIGGSNFKY